jgi:proliferating cell nuclear antigen
MTNNNNRNNYIVELQTVQSAAFKTLVEAMKESVPDINLEFDKTGLRVVSMDESCTVLVHLQLEADKFQYYKCTQKQNIGISLPNLYKIFKNMNNSDILTLYVASENTDVLGIRMENGEKQQIGDYDMNLMEVNEEDISIEDHEYPFILDMPANDFQQICRNMKNLNTKTIEIQYAKEKLMFSTTGEIARHKLTRMAHVNNGNKPEDCLKIVKIPTDSHIIYKGIFNLEKLIDFSKCNSFSSTVQIHLRDKYPLLLIYDVASLGSVKLCLAPLTVNE